VTRIPRPAAAAALALVALTSAGCSVTNPQTTELQYMPADGVEGRLSPTITVTSVLVAAADKQGPGHLIARVTNSGTEPASVTFTGTGDAQVDLTVRVDGGETVDVGPKGREAMVEPVGEIPGALVPITVAVEGGEPVELEAPVLDATFEPYATLVPTPDASA
jgi:hypothetical protein